MLDKIISERLQIVTSNRGALLRHRKNLVSHFNILAWRYGKTPRQGSSRQPMIFRGVLTPFHPTLSRCCGSHAGEVERLIGRLPESTLPTSPTSSSLLDLSAVHASRLERAYRSSSSYYSTGTIFRPTDRHGRTYGMEFPVGF